jgi:hypothetical protein
MSKDQSYPCEGAHNFFIAEVVGVPSEGTVHVLAKCRICGEFSHDSVKVATPGAPIRLLREESQKTKEN